MVRPLGRPLEAGSHGRHGKRARTTTEAFIAAWNQPSTVVLAVILTANLLLPVSHFWPGDSPPEGSRHPEKPATRVQTPSAVSAAEERTTRPQLHRALEPRPVAPPSAATRVSLRKATPVCRAWGPFDEVAAAEAAAVRLALSPGTFEVYQSRVHAEPDYLVFVRASRSLEEARLAMSHLQENGLDSYIMERGQAGNRLAAGVFSSLERAEAQHRRVVELGYEGGIEPLDRSRRTYHLMARVAADRTLDVAPLGSCDDIAPLQQFL